MKYLFSRGVLQPYAFDMKLIYEEPKGWKQAVKKWGREKEPLTMVVVGFQGIYRPPKEPLAHLEMKFLFL